MGGRRKAMKKLLAIGSLLLTSAAVLATPALAADRDDFARPNESTYQARIDQRRRDDRIERERREYVRRDVRDFHSDRDGGR
jgi:hypothetical protein